MTGEYIDEMKLQKLLYFSQRESLAILNKPMFSENLKDGNMDQFLEKLEHTLLKKMGYKLIQKI